MSEIVIGGRHAFYFMKSYLPNGDCVGRVYQTFADYDEEPYVGSFAFASCEKKVIGQKTVWVLHGIDGLENASVCIDDSENALEQIYNYFHGYFNDPTKKRENIPENMWSFYRRLSQTPVNVVCEKLVISNQLLWGFEKGVKPLDTKRIGELLMLYYTNMKSVRESVLDSLDELIDHMDVLSESIINEIRQSK